MNEKTSEQFYFGGEQNQVINQTMKRQEKDDKIYFRSEKLERFLLMVRVQI